MNINKNKTVVVTGCTGQMGSYMVDYLIDQGLNVIGTARRLSVPNEENLKQLKNKDQFIVELMDLGDAHSINNIIQKYKPEYFINCAANSFVGSSWDCPEQHMDFNSLGVLRQLEAIRKYSPSTRYYNFGSSEEFGDVVFSPQNEEHPPRARSPYGASKVAARQLTKVYRDSYKLFAIQGWHFNYESERRGIEFVTRKITKGVSDIYHKIRVGQQPTPIQLGNLDARRDWSHCLDIAEGAWMMLNNTEPKEYVLSSNETHSIREFVELAFAYAGFGQENCQWVGEKENEMYMHGSQVLVKINPEYYRPAEVSLLHGDSTLARQELGWKPKSSFQDLVRKMVENDLKLNENGNRQSNKY